MTEDKAVFTAPRGNSPAFPCKDGKNQIWTGMNLRDYIAMEALHALIDSGQWQTFANKELVQNAYELANLMLSEREKHK